MTKVSKKQATNARTGRLKKGYKATKSGYFKVTASKSKTKIKRKASSRRKAKSGIKAKVKRVLRKMKIG